MPIASIEAGKGPPLVLLHGIGSNARSWRRQIEDLSSDFRVIAWDAPGYGRSADPPVVEPSMRFYADSLRALLTEKNLQRSHILGHSMGGIIAQEFYRVYPECISKLILADTTSGGGPKARLDERLRMIRTLTPSELARARAPRLLSRHAPDELVQEAISIMSEIRPPGYEFAARAMANADNSDVLEEIQARALLIWGADDEITPAWTHAAVQIIPKAGHLCYMEQPAIFNAMVRTFLT